jgi:hypothetical protein
MTPLFQSKRRFILVSGLLWGVPLWALMIWVTWQLRGIGWWLYLLAICLAGGLAWGLCMWHYFSWRRKGADSGQEDNA